MPDTSCLANPKVEARPFAVSWGCSPTGQGVEAGMKPREGKHAVFPRWFSGGTSPRGGPHSPGGFPLGPLFSPFRCASSAVPPLPRGPLFFSPGRLRTTCSSTWHRCPGLPASLRAFSTSGPSGLSPPRAAKPQGSSACSVTWTVKPQGFIFVCMFGDPCSGLTAEPLGSSTSSATWMDKPQGFSVSLHAHVVRHRLQRILLFDIRLAGRSCQR